MSFLAMLFVKLNFTLCLVISMTFSLKMPGVKKYGKNTIFMIPLENCKHAFFTRH